METIPHPTIEQEEHGAEVTGDLLFAGWLGPWFLRRRRWFREYGSLAYRYQFIAKRRTHKGPKV